MKYKQSAEILVQTANQVGVVQTLHSVFGKNIKVQIGFGSKACDTSIEELDYSVRAFNSLKRAGVTTVGQTIDLIASDELLKIRNLGKKTEVEIKTRILAFGYGWLTELQKKQFFVDLLQLNCTEE